MASFKLRLWRMSNSTVGSPSCPIDLDCNPGPPSRHPVKALGHSPDAPVDLSLPDLRRRTGRSRYHRGEGSGVMGNCCVSQAEGAGEKKLPEQEGRGGPARTGGVSRVVDPMPPPPLLREGAVQEIGGEEFARLVALRARNGDDARERRREDLLPPLQEGHAQHPDGRRMPVNADAWVQEKDGARREAGEQENEGGDGDLDFETALVMLMSQFPEASPEQAGASLAAAMEEEVGRISLREAMQKAADDMREEGFVDGEEAKQVENGGGEDVDPFFLLHPAAVWRDGEALPVGGPLQEAPLVQRVVREGGGGGEMEGEREGVTEMDLADPFSLSDVPAAVRKEYCAVALQKLQDEFPRVGMSDIRKALRANHQRLGATHKALIGEMEKAVAAEKGGGEGEGGHVEIIRLLKRRRCRPNTPRTATCPLVDAEWEAVCRQYALVQEGTDAEVAREINEEEYEKEGQQIECGCCFGDFPFEGMVQCGDGHLFCFTCVQRRVEESTFGAAQAAASLPCMAMEGCEEAFPPSEVRRALPGATLEQYEQRQAEDSVAKARLENVNLVSCPFCHVAVEMEKGGNVLACPNTECNKSSCRLCKGSSHTPLRCDEVEKEEETDVRKRVEELMSLALIRTCTKCAAEVVKDLGCNKVRCRCGQYMCYVCRKVIDNYSHFCQHPGDPGKRCALCSACSLWAKEDEAEVVEAARKEALASLQLTEEQYAVALKRGVGITKKQKRDS